MNGGAPQGVAGWTTVGKRIFRKRVPHWDTFLSTKMTKDSTVVSIYVSNFPDFVKAKEMLDMLSDTAEVLEVSIAPRRNKWGKQFGFARFIEVEDAHLLVVKLDNMVIREAKIHANIPRYERKVYADEVGKFKGREPTSGIHRSFEAEVKRPFRAQAGGWKGHRSFVDVVADRTPEASFSNQIEKKISLMFNSKPEVREIFSKAWAGVLRCPGSMSGLQQCIERAGFFALRITPLGANKCLLEGYE